jgi:hypothetical protein
MSPILYLLIKYGLLQYDDEIEFLRVPRAAIGVGEHEMSLLHRSNASSSQPLNGREVERGEVRTISASIHTVGCSGLRTVSVRGFRLASGDGADIAGFDLGPSPEEHLLAALGSSLAQAVASVACARDLCVDRLDIALEADLLVDPLSGTDGVSIRQAGARAVIASEDPAGHFAGVSDEVLARAAVVRAVSFPVTLHIDVVAIEPAEQYSDWQI